MTPLLLFINLFFSFSFAGTVYAEEGFEGKGRPFQCILFSGASSCSFAVLWFLLSSLWNFLPFSFPAFFALLSYYVLLLHFYLLSLIAGTLHYFHESHYTAATLEDLDT